MALQKLRREFVHLVLQGRNFRLKMFLLFRFWNRRLSRKEDPIAQVLSGEDPRPKRSLIKELKEDDRPLIEPLHDERGRKMMRSSSLSVRLLLIRGRERGEH